MAIVTHFACPPTPAAICSLLRETDFDLDVLARFDVWSWPKRLKTRRASPCDFGEAVVGIGIAIAIGYNQAWC
jgi:hypothetical protein